MHLDTVFTLLDRDKATAYPKVVGDIRAISLRPGQPRRASCTSPRSRTSSAQSPTRSASNEAPRRRDRRRRVPAGAGAVGRRQQRRRPRARRRRRLRAQHLHHRQDARGRGRGGRDRRLRARQGPRRWPLHDLPHRAGPDLTGAVEMAEPTDPGPLRWILIVIVVVALVCLLAFRRNDPGVGGRVPDPEDVAVRRARPRVDLTDDRRDVHPVRHPGRPRGGDAGSRSRFKLPSAYTILFGAHRHHRARDLDHPGRHLPARRGGLADPGHLRGGRRPRRRGSWSTRSRHRSTASTASRTRPPATSTCSTVASCSAPSTWPCSSWSSGASSGITMRTGAIQGGIALLVRRLRGPRAADDPDPHDGVRHRRLRPSAWRRRAWRSTCWSSR